MTLKTVQVVVKHRRSVNKGERQLKSVYSVLTRNILRKPLVIYTNKKEENVLRNA